MKKSIELEPEEPSYLETLGNEYERKGKIFDALALLERVSILQPDREEIYIRLGDLYRQKQYLQKAVSRYWSAVAINSENIYVHETLKEIFEILTEKEKEKLELLMQQSPVTTTHK